MLKRTWKIVSTIIAAILIGWMSGAVGPIQAQTTGFITTGPSLLRPVGAGVTVKHILSVADTLHGGYTMPSVPGGLGAFDNKDGTFTLYMNHELTAGSTTNLTDARISKLRIRKDDLRVVEGKELLSIFHFHFNRAKSNRSSDLRYHGSFNNALTTWLPFLILG